MKENAPVAPNPYEPPATSPPGDVKSAIVDHRQLPPLMRDGSFWGLTLTQFLGAFNDNLFKQLVLLLAVSFVSSSTAGDNQDVAAIVFALPFVLFSGFAGYLSDRYSKRNITVWAKVAEIAIMLLGVAGFLLYGTTGYVGLLVVLFLMGAQSAFFGPSKYGILPELFRGTDLPRANGIIIMTTFLAIIFGTVAAGVLRDLLVERTAEGAMDATRLWIGSLACVGIAVVGTLTSAIIRPTPRAVPDLAFRLSSLAIPPETRAVLRRDLPLVQAILASSMFWMVSGVTVLVVNYVGTHEMGFDAAESGTPTSALSACLAIGIMVGAVIAGKLSRGKVDFRLTRVGAFGIVVCLTMLGLFSDGRQLLGFGLSIPTMVMLGTFAAFFAIPVQVFIQARPTEDQKGRVIAVMNLANFTAILFSGAIYGVFDRFVRAVELPHSPIFIMTGLIILPVALFYRPRSIELSA